MKKIIYAATLLACINSAMAETTTFGKWKVFDSANQAPLALTTNDSDNAFGQFCTDEDQKCYWVIFSINTPCIKEEKSPMLGNSSAGSSSFNTRCAGVVDIYEKKYHRYVIWPFDDVESMITRSSGMISFALPTKGGSFTVMRFDLNGSTKAISYLEKLKIKFAKKINSDSTKDISL